MKICLPLKLPRLLSTRSPEIDPSLREKTCNLPLTPPSWKMLKYVQRIRRTKYRHLVCGKILIIQLHLLLVCFQSITNTEKYNYAKRIFFILLLLFVFRAFYIPKPYNWLHVPTPPLPLAIFLGGKVPKSNIIFQFLSQPNLLLS